MESSLTKLEIDAVLQLIELSGGCAEDLRVLWLKFSANKYDQENKQFDETEGKSVSHEASSSSLIESENCSDDEALPRRNERFGSLVDIYRKTRPSIRNRAKKRARF